MFRYYNINEIMNNNIRYSLFIKAFVFDVVFWLNYLNIKYIKLINLIKA